MGLSTNMLEWGRIETRRTFQKGFHPIYLADFDDHVGLDRGHTSRKPYFSISKHSEIVNIWKYHVLKFTYLKMTGFENYCSWKLMVLIIALSDFCWFRKFNNWKIRFQNCLNWRYLHWKILESVKHYLLPFYSKRTTFITLISQK